MMLFFIVYDTCTVYNQEYLQVLLSTIWNIIKGSIVVNVYVMFNMYKYNIYMYLLFMFIYSQDL